MGKKIFLTENQFKDFIRYQRNKSNLYETVVMVDNIKKGINEGKSFDNIFDSLTNDGYYNVIKAKEIYEKIINNKEIL